jgi:hypothetical protein
VYLISTYCANVIYANRSAVSALTIRIRHVSITTTLSSAILFIVTIVTIVATVGASAIRSIYTIEPAKRVVLA